MSHGRHWDPGGGRERGGASPAPAARCRGSARSGGTSERKVASAWVCGSDDLGHHVFMSSTETRGRDADSPLEIPKEGWRDVALRLKREAKDDNLSLLSGGVAFFAMLSLVPGIVAAVSLYGLVADPKDFERQVRDVTKTLPVEARNLIIEQVRRIVNTSSAGLGFAAIAGALLALWSASAAVKHLIEAVNTTYDEKDQRGFLKLRGMSVVLALGGLVFMLGAVILIAVLPSALGDSSLGGALRLLLNVLRWPLLALAMIAALSVVYRVAPDRDDPKWRWVSQGAVFATVAWIGASLLLS